MPSTSSRRRPTAPTSESTGSAACWCWTSGAGRSREACRTDHARVAQALALVTTDTAYAGPFTMVNQVRSTFVKFFEEKAAHTYWPSSPVVPHDDPTLLFCNAGMKSEVWIAFWTTTRASVKRKISRQQRKIRVFHFWKTI